MPLRSAFSLMATTALLLTACGGGSETTLSAGEGNVVRVEASDRQDYNADVFEATAGEVIFELSQSGIQEHTLVVESHEGEMRLVVVDGSTDLGSLHLEPGRYFLYCDIAGHRSSGMEARLTVN